jgi:hypothetical protein
MTAYYHGSLTYLVDCILDSNWALRAQIHLNQI